MAVKFSSNVVNAIQRHRKKWEFHVLWLDLFVLFLLLWLFVFCVFFNVFVYSKFAVMLYFLFPSVSIVRPWWFLQK